MSAETEQAQLEPPHQISDILIDLFKDDTPTGDFTPSYKTSVEEPQNPTSPIKMYIDAYRSPLYREITPEICELYLVENGATSEEIQSFREATIVRLQRIQQLQRSLHVLRFYDKHSFLAFAGVNAVTFLSTVTILSNAKTTDEITTFFSAYSLVINWLFVCPSINKSIKKREFELKEGGKDIVSRVLQTNNRMAQYEEFDEFYNS